MTQDIPRTQPVDDSAPRPACTSPRAWLLLAVVAALGLVTDLASKWAAFEFLPDSPAHVQRGDVLAAMNMSGPNGLIALVPDARLTVVPKLLDFTLVLNPGAVFGLGAGRRWFFIVFTLAAVAFATTMFARWTSRRDHLAHAGIALLVSGGLGNLYDRVVYACVRDFIHPLPGVKLPFGLAWPNGSPEVWPYVSNLADLYLLIGIAALIFFAWRKPPDPTDRPTHQDNDARTNTTAAATHTPDGTTAAAQPTQHPPAELPPA